MYKIFNNPLNTEPCGVTLDNHTAIPFNPENTDYQEYLKWLAEGNTPEPADEPNP